MGDTHHQPAGQRPSKKPNAPSPDFIALLKEILGDILQTPEARKLMAGMTPVVLKAWAGESAWRKIISKTAGRTVSRGFAGTRAKGDGTVEALFEDPAFLHTLVEWVTTLCCGIANILDTGVRAITGMPPEDQTKFAAENLARVMQGRSGAVVTGGARFLSEIQKNDPEFFVRLLEPGFRQWVESVDFGELKEAVEVSAPGDARRRRHGQ